MFSGNMADRISHCQYGQPQGEADPEKSDAQRWQTRGEHGAAGARKSQPESAEEFGSQVLGAIVAAAVLYAIASGKPDWVPAGFASNGYGDLSPGKYGLASCFLIEVIRDHGSSTPSGGRTALARPH